ncbi:ABC transporter ATP-binding protein [Sporomusa sp.]|uniref:ABC transporter ATP-binding protein n=1 Tax=Sporomusa sp. TaxID=2078658 RepID=UPI002BCFD1F8|nr:ABC transporter ATP-binding protein [Sporomusa sp.]HWR07733.1 ABC transporter ATP-binding protein [Sporomusa sp.]
MSYFSLNNLTKRYDSNLVLNNINLSIEQGTFLSLLGPSGCGKTTTLKIVAGFESPDAGEVFVAGEVYNNLPVYHRNVGMVFQSYALFPHMTIEQNIAFGLEQRKIDRVTIKKQVAEAIDMVQLTGLEKRKPKQLSGGQQQRVALARALVIKPRLLLLDESLSALDKKLRVDMQVELRQIQKRVGITTIFVTHDQEEALTLSDKIAVMKDGNIVQLDAPHVVYEQPCNMFVAGFLGQSNFFTGVIKAIDNGNYCLELKNGDHIQIAAAAGAARRPGQACILAVRPERIRLEAERPEGKPGLCGRIKFITYAGNISNFRVEVMGAEVIVQLQNSFSGERFNTGDKVYLTWDQAGSVLLDE